METIDIQKIAETPLDEKTGFIYNGTNIDDKTSNTYSANIIDNLFNEIGNGEWNYATINTDYLLQGIVGYKIIGKMVVVYIQDLILSANVVSHNVLASGLPKPDLTQMIFMLNGSTGSEYNPIDSLRVAVDGAGNFIDWYDVKTASPDMYYNGQVIYFTN